VISEVNLSELLHLTSSLRFTSLITAILLHYCFISILF